MMPKPTIHGAWEGYRQAIILKDAPEVQITECRRAFYAGAHTLMTLIMGNLNPARDPTQEDVDFLSGIQRELEAFTEGVLSGRA